MDWYASQEKKLQIKVVQNWILYKKVREHMWLSPPSGARWLERLIWMEYYIILKWQIIFNLGPNADKNTNNLKTCSNKNCSEFNFLQKTHLCICLLPPGVELGGSSSYSNRTLMKLQWQMFKAPYLHSCGRYRHMGRLSFCRKLNFEQFLFDPFFLIKCKFSFQYNIICSHINLHAATPGGWFLELNIDNKSIKLNSPKSWEWVAHVIVLRRAGGLSAAVCS